MKLNDKEKKIGVNYISYIIYKILNSKINRKNFERETHYIVLISLLNRKELLNQSTIYLKLSNKDKQLISNFFKEFLNRFRHRFEFTNNNQRLNFLNAFENTKNIEFLNDKEHHKIIDTYTTKIKNKIYNNLLKDQGFLFLIAKELFPIEEKTHKNIVNNFNLSFIFLNDEYENLKYLFYSSYFEYWTYCIFQVDNKNIYYKINEIIKKDIKVNNFKKIKFINLIIIGRHLSKIQKNSKEITLNKENKENLLFWMKKNNYKNINKDIKMLETLLLNKKDKIFFHTDRENIIRILDFIFDKVNCFNGYNLISKLNEERNLLIDLNILKNK